MSAILKRPVLPKITIKKNDASLYTYDPLSSIFDFRLTNFVVRAPFDSTGGQYDMTIVSSDVSNSAMLTFLSNINLDNEVTIWVGKTTGTLKKIFLGKIETISDMEPNLNLMRITVSGPDWGSDLLKNLIINYSWIQKKDVADQNKLDSLDKLTTIGQIVSDAMTIANRYPDENYPVTAQNLGVIVTAANYPDPANSYQVPQFEANMESLDDKLNELDELGGYSHHIDAEKTFYMKPSASLSVSDVLLTDNETDSEITGSPSYVGKVGFIESGCTIDETIENHKARIYGLGSNTFVKDKSQETVTTSSSLLTEWKAQKFSPDKQDCYQIGVYIGYTGTPSQPLTLLLVEDVAGQPTGSTLRTLSVNYPSLTPGGGWYYFPIGEKVTQGNSYWIVIAGNITGYTYLWHRDTATNNINAFSTNGTSWTVNTSSFGFCFIMLANDPVLATFPTGVTASTRHLHDEVIRRSDITDANFMLNYIQTLFLRMGKKKQIFKGRVYSPDVLLAPNQYIRIRKQVSGKTVDAFFVLGQVEYVFESDEEQTTGQVYIDVEATRFIDYP